MSNSPLLLAVCALAGLLVGAAVVYAAPRLAAQRVEPAPPRPGALVLIPIVGAAVMRWRMPRSVVTQILCAALFVLLAAHFGARRTLLIALVYTALLAIIAYIDLDYRLVLNALSYPGFVIALGGSLFWSGIGPESSLLGAVTGLVIFTIFQLIGRGALGTGDTKLAAVIGAMTGFPAVFNALLLGMILGGLGAIGALVILRRGRKDYIPYAPYLAAGAVLSFLFVHG